MSNIQKKTLFLLAALAATVAVSSTTYAGVELWQALASPGLNPDHTSIMVADAATGQVIAEHQADLSLNPASCAKLLTSATALATLGPNYHLSTGFYSDHAPSGGTIGTLYVSGNGDPSLITEELWRMSQNLYARGLRRVTGGIVIDESYFDSHEYPRKGGNEGRAYTAKTAAVAVNFNSIGVTVGPGRRAGNAGTVELVPPVEGIKIVNKLVTRAKFGVNIAIQNNGDTIVVTGRVPPKAQPQTFWRAIPDPVAHAGRVIAYVLRQNGIAIEGPVQSGRVPASAHTIAIEPSRSMAEIVADMNKNSNNFMAEQLIKHLGAVHGGMPGSTAKGVAAIAEYLGTIGVVPGTYELENGSGLSEHTRISAQQLVKVLVAAYRNRTIRDPFIASLSVLGVDGTMKRWSRAGRELTGTVYAKTGTLNGVSTLAGYVPMRDGRWAAFAILANSVPRGAWGAHEAQLAVVRTIAEGGR